MNDISKSAISPLTIAHTLARVTQCANAEVVEKFRSEPRLSEVLWWLQNASVQPGGLPKLGAEIIEQMTPHFGPPCVHDRSRLLTLQEREQVWKLISDEVEEEIIPYQKWARPSRFQDGILMAYDVVSVFGYYPIPEDPDELQRFRAALSEVPESTFRDVFINNAKDGLSNRLRSMCEGEPDSLINAPWYCQNLVSVLIEMMELHASRIELTIARTEVVSLVFDRLDYCWEEKVPVFLQGDTRTGKSFALNNWCKMNPGKARLIATPSSPSDRDLFIAIADALGLVITPKTTNRELRDTIQFIIRHSGLMFIFDESHFVLPVRYYRNTSPVRLDWIRTQIVDRKLPIAFVSTPQAFQNAVAKFTRTTGHNFSQFLGRVMLNTDLPTDLSTEDLLEVCKIQGPDVPVKIHKFIVARAKSSEGYLKAIEAICCRARYIARREKHPTITLEDVTLAASEVIPAANSFPVKAPQLPKIESAPIRKSLPGAKVGRNQSAPAPLPPSSSFEAPARVTMPAPSLALSILEPV